jgi:hypothetical protein
MNRIPLAETIAAIRTELRSAVVLAAGETVQFPVGQITLEFQVGVTKSTEGTAGVNVWIFEAGAGGTYAREAVQKVTIILESPLDERGEPIKVASAQLQRPG